MTEKTCHACGKTKPISDFYRSSSSKDGYAASCKDCQMGRTPKTEMVSTPKKKVQFTTLSGAMKTNQEKRQDELIYRAGCAPDSRGAFPAKDRPIKRTMPQPMDVNGLDAGFAKFWDDPERKFEVPRSGNYAWWHDPNRIEMFRRFPRAVTIQSVNVANGTALVYFFADGFSRKMDQALVQIADIRRREA